VNAVQGRASALSEGYDKGEVTDIAKVMLARQEAGMAFEATLQCATSCSPPIKTSCGWGSDQMADAANPDTGAPAPSLSLLPRSPILWVAACWRALAPSLVSRQCAAPCRWLPGFPQQVSPRCCGSPWPPPRSAFYSDLSDSERSQVVAALDKAETRLRDR